MAEVDEIINWRHPEDDADEWDGFNHSGIEHFLGNPLFSIGREICQNELDASDGSESASVVQPVRNIRQDTLRGTFSRPRIGKLPGRVKRSDLVLDAPEKKPLHRFTLVRG